MSRSLVACGLHDNKSPEGSSFNDCENKKSNGFTERHNFFPLTYLTQRWPYEEIWSLKRIGEQDVFLPSGRTYFLAANEYKTIVLPWVIQ